MKQIHLYIASCLEDGGIYHYKLENKELIFEEMLPLKEPMYMIIEKNKLYCILKNPFDNNMESGFVEIELNNGYFGKCSEIISTHGKEACHLCCLDGKIYIANYISGNICRMPNLVVQHQGKGINQSRQEGPHTHCIIPTPDKKYLCATDLGTDEIIIYDKDLNPVSKAQVEAGSGPRHLIFSKDGTHLYCINELYSNVSVFSYTYKNSIPTLTLKSTHSALPQDYKDESTAAAIRLYNGKLYVSNRGHDSVAYFDENNGVLGTPNFVKTGGNGPRDIFIIDNMLICANEISNTVTIFDLQDGIPTKTEQEIQMKKPLAIEALVLNENFEMRLYDKPFYQIKEGKKTIELRLNDEKRQNLQVGDIIKFVRKDNEEESIKTKVVAIHKFPSFEALFKVSDLYSKCGCENMSIEASVLSMRKYYSVEQEKKFGACGIEIELVE